MYVCMHVVYLSIYLNIYFFPPPGLFKEVWAWMGMAYLEVREGFFHEELAIHESSLI